MQSLKTPKEDSDLVARASVVRIAAEFALAILSTTSVLFKNIASAVTQSIDARTFQSPNTIRK
jgi:hypothetical protein